MKKHWDIFILLAVLALDLASKQVISTQLSLHEMISVIPGFFAITYYQNTGMAWSLFSNAPLLLTLVSGVITIVLLSIYKDAYKENDKFMRLCTILMLAGAFGNLYDRLFLGYVRDFLSFNIFGYPFPVFNIADSSLVIGGILWIVYCIFVEGNSKGAK